MTDDGVRIRLVLSEKFRVLTVHTSSFGKTAKVALGGSTTLTMHIPFEQADIREGDLLTFYTEVPLAKPS